MTEQRAPITLVQPVPDAAWFAGAIDVWDAGQRYLPRTPDNEVESLACHLRGNLSVSADALLVDGPTLWDILDGALTGHTAPEYHGWGCGIRASLSNPCTCWRANARAMLESLAEAKT